MLHYNKIDISKGIDPTKSNKSNYWVFNYVFKFQDYVCNGCHDLTMLSVNIKDIDIIAVKNIDYRCIIYNISKTEAINLLRNSVLPSRAYI